MSRFAQDLFRHTENLAANRDDFVLITWIRSEGHAPQDVGAKAIITRAGLHWGSVGGGKVEARAIRYGLELLSETKETSGPILLRWDLQKDIGMSCGGSVHLLFETFLACPWSIVVFGAGHVGQALVRSLALIDCHVTCVDTRQEWLDKLPSSHQQLKIIATEDMAVFASDLPPKTYCVLVTKGHDTDVPILRRLVQNPHFPYIGVIGSKVKARKLRAELQREGFSPESVQRIHCPMGIPLSTHRPSEIAISIMAQLILVKNKGFMPETEP